MGKYEVFIEAAGFNSDADIVGIIDGNGPSKPTTFWSEKPQGLLRCAVSLLASEAYGTMSKKHIIPVD